VPIKKLAAPLVIVFLVSLYILGVTRVLLRFNLTLTIKAAVIIVPLAIVGTLLFVLWERIREIRSGEEDDLGKY